MGFRMLRQGSSIVLLMCLAAFSISTPVAKAQEQPAPEETAPLSISVRGTRLFDTRFPDKADRRTELSMFGARPTLLLGINFGRQSERVARGRAATQLKAEFVSLLKLLDRQAKQWREQGIDVVLFDMDYSRRGDRSSRNEYYGAKADSRKRAAERKKLAAKKGKKKAEARTNSRNTFEPKNLILAKAEFYDPAPYFSVPFGTSEYRLSKAKADRDRLKLPKSARRNALLKWNKENPDPNRQVNETVEQRDDREQSLLEGNGDIEDFFAVPMMTSYERGFFTSVRWGWMPRPGAISAIGKVRWTAGDLNDPRLAALTGAVEIDPLQKSSLTRKAYTSIIQWRVDDAIKQIAKLELDVEKGALKLPKGAIERLNGLVDAAIKTYRSSIAAPLWGNGYSVEYTQELEILAERLGGSDRAKKIIAEVKEFRQSDEYKEFKKTQSAYAKCIKKITQASERAKKITATNASQARGWYVKFIKQIKAARAATAAFLKKKQNNESLYAPEMRKWVKRMSLQIEVYEIEKNLPMSR